ncbi:unnamed protein product [Prorocentrum cordatum]|uniref:Pentatricopeptide repeat-containing protein n=1 Tax=Prorocentrum cordatum TaxID=2364126 RepID=A0ABN9R438_9DINO|nr:unnamed protein product [Polarella glacialis]
MQRTKLKPSVISSAALGVSACEEGEQRQRALALLSEMWKFKLEPNVLSYNAGISACEKGELHQRALALLSDMWEMKLEPNAVAAGPGAAERDVEGEAGAQRHLPREGRRAGRVGDVVHVCSRGAPRHHWVGLRFRR